MLIYKEENPQRISCRLNKLFPVWTTWSSSTYGVLSHYKKLLNVGDVSILRITVSRNPEKQLQWGVIELDLTISRMHAGQQ